MPVLIWGDTVRPYIALEKSIGQLGIVYACILCLGYLRKRRVDGRVITKTLILLNF